MLGLAVLVLAVLVVLAGWVGLDFGGILVESCLLFVREYCSYAYCIIITVICEETGVKKTESKYGKHVQCCSAVQTRIFSFHFVSFRFVLVKDIHRLACHTCLPPSFTTFTQPPTAHLEGCKVIHGLITDVLSIINLRSQNVR